VSGAPWSKKWNFTTIDPERQQADAARRLLERANRARGLAGLTKLTYDDKLSSGCRAHALYVMKNFNHPRVAGLGVHEEDPRLPGATPAGARAGKAGIIAIIHDPQEAVETWLATLYHRVPLLDPRLKRLGCGLAQHPMHGWVAVLDTGSGK
jgi:uncharacterized protein YkwD